MKTNVKWTIHAVLLSLGILFSAAHSFADVKIITSPINGEAIKLPTGEIQIMGPTLTFKGVRYPLCATWKEATDTAKMACTLLKKEYVDHSVSLNGCPTGGCDPKSKHTKACVDETTLFFHNDINDGGDRVINVLSCR